jgi:hypothetical protein
VASVGDSLGWQLVVVDQCREKPLDQRDRPTLATSLPRTPHPRLGAMNPPRTHPHMRPCTPGTMGCTGQTDGFGASQLNSRTSYLVKAEKVCYSARGYCRQTASSALGWPSTRAARPRLGLPTRAQAERWLTPGVKSVANSAHVAPGCRVLAEERHAPMAMENRKRQPPPPREHLCGSPGAVPFEEACGLREGELGYRLHTRCRPGARTSARASARSSITGVA